MVNDPENTEEVSKQETEEQDHQHEGDTSTGTDSPAGNDVLTTRDVPSGNL